MEDVTTLPQQDPVVPLFVESMYDEVMKQGTQRKFRSRVVDPLFRHFLSVCGPCISIVLSLLILLILLMIIMIILLCVTIRKKIPSCFDHP